MLRLNQQQELIYFKNYKETRIVPTSPTFTDWELLKNKKTGTSNVEAINKTTIFIKRVFDIGFSLGVLVLGLPVFLTLMFIVKLTSKGPVLYKQERMGENCKPFYIYKFRSMKNGAEQSGPQLTSENDPRITKWGTIMRKTHLDELPQFWNVLIGEMSIVGPRPEREHFIKKILKKAPNYAKLRAIKPGITSIGQVYYGYAESVDEMCDRMRFDLMYLKDMNILTDLNIILKTVMVMFQRKGQ